MSRPIERKFEHDDRKRPAQDKPTLADERGWSGQHGQHAANEEEEDYRPNQRPGTDGLGSE